MQNVVELKLTSEWLGNPPGSIVRVGTRQAEAMMIRKIAEINDGGGDDGKQEKAKEDTGSAVKTGKEGDEKEVKMQKRVLDKQVKSSTNK